MLNNATNRSVAVQRAAQPPLSAPGITKQEFIERYCKRNNVTPEGLSRHRVVLPCACGDDSCEGWALVRNDTQSILEHENGPDGA